MMKGQTAMEFVILMSFMMLIFAVTFVVIQYKSLDIMDANTERQVMELANVIKSEIEMADNVLEGYQKTFRLPDYINGEDYTISYTNSEVSITYKGKNHFIFLDTVAPITGTLNKGLNNIKKGDTGIKLNQ